MKILAIVGLVAVLQIIAPVQSVATAPQTWQEFRATIEAARDLLKTHFARIEARSKLAASLQERLDTDEGTFVPSSKPAWLSNQVYLAYALSVAQLDRALIEQLAKGSPHILSGQRGADDVTFTSTADGSQQPLGVYVPRTYDPRTPAPLVIFLHGFTQTEADEIASPWIRAAADASGAVIGAPFARGDEHFAAGAPEDDVYQAVEVMRHAFNIDPKRIFLAGHSMGGFGVFTVVVAKPRMWSAVLSASGALTEEDKAVAMSALAGKTVYIVQGSDDTVVPALYARRTARQLTAAGITVRYYEQPNGAHGLGTIHDAFARAWRDMLDGRTTGTAIPQEGS